jgi:protein-S-isoprenylcysteine O-methyltransferase Ste14
LVILTSKNDQIISEIGIMTSIDNTAEIIEFTRLYLAVFYSAVALFYTIKIITTKIIIHTELIFLGQRYCPNWWNHMTFRIFRAAIWMVCVVRLFLPALDDYLGLIPSLENTPMLLSGNILLTFGFLITIIIHFSMSQKWRSGIDPKGPKKLITDGFFSYSRNPIFVSVAISQIGFFLALPSVFTLVCLIIGLYTLYKQTIAEESHLSAVFPSEYTHYTANVRRWL